MMAYFQIYNVYAVLLTLSVPQLKDVVELFQSFLHSLTQFTVHTVLPEHTALLSCYHPLSPSSLDRRFCHFVSCVWAVLWFSFPVIPVHFTTSLSRAAQLFCSSGKFNFSAITGFQGRHDSQIFANCRFWIHFGILKKNHDSLNRFFFQHHLIINLIKNATFLLNWQV